MTPEDMAGMKECFLTGTAAEVTPVRGLAIGTFTPAEASRQLVDGAEDLRGRISIDLAVISLCWLTSRRHPTARGHRRALACLDPAGFTVAFLGLARRSSGNP